MLLDKTVQRWIPKTTSHENKDAFIAVVAIVASHQNWVAIDIEN